MKIWIETDALTKDGVEKNLLLCENYVELDGLVFIGQKWHRKSEVIPYLQSFFMEQENASSVEVTELADIINPPSIRNWVSLLAKKWRSEWESHCLMQASDSPQKLKETRRL